MRAKVSLQIININGKFIIFADKSMKFFPKKKYFKKMKKIIDMSIKSCQKNGLKGKSLKY